MELSRNEVITIYNILKDTNLLGMTTDCKKAFIVNSIKLKPIAEQINSENTEVADRLRTDEYVESFKAFLKAKETFESNKTKETAEAYNKAAIKFDPLFKDMEEKYNAAISELQQTFDVELTKVATEDYLEYLEHQGKDFTVNALTPLEKMFE